MGLFRRGTQLLKLGGGMRDCCCRPEKPPVPEDCWCPDLCSYYWEWGGDIDFPGQKSFLVNNKCNPYYTEGADIAGDQPANADAVLFPPGLFALGRREGAGDGASITFSRGQAVTWVPDQGLSDEIIAFFFAQQGGGATREERVNRITESSFGSVKITCLQLREPGFRIEAERTCQVLICYDILGAGYCQTNGKIDFALINYRQYAGGNIFNALPSSCQRNDLLKCPEDISVLADGLWYSHLLDGTQLSWSDSGLFVNGALIYEWIYAPPRIGQQVLPDALTGSLASFHKPISASVTLKRHASCRSGPCDCNESLGGAIVLFEGKTFSYGSFDEFVSDDGITRWAELLPGLFVRYDYDPCDPSQFFIASTLTAEVFCTSVDGQDYWGVTLQRQCAERSACQPATDAERTTIWSGIFECDPDGKPTGDPHSAADPLQPPDLDSDVTSGGTPSGDCAGIPTIPSFRFS
jgi:hypothetical protein